MQRNGNSENPSDVVIEVTVAHQDERQVAETMFTSRTFKLPERRNAMSTLDNATSPHAAEERNVYFRQRNLAIRNHTCWLYQKHRF